MSSTLCANFSLTVCPCSCSFFKAERLLDEKKLATRLRDPFFGLWKILKAVTGGKQFAAALLSGPLQQGVVLQASGEDFPAHGVDRTVRARINQEGVPVGPVWPVPRIGHVERINYLVLLMTVPVVVAPVQEALEGPAVEQPATHSDLG